MMPDVPITLTEGEAVLLVQFLRLLGSWLGNRGCNDFNLRDAGLSSFDIVDLRHKVQEMWPDEPLAEGDIQFDFHVVGYLREKIQRALDRGIPEMP